jgi:hypothetical protein
MSSGRVSDIANQPPMPSRPEEFHRESLSNGLRNGLSPITRS